VCHHFTDHARAAEGAEAAEEHEAERQEPAALLKGHGDGDDAGAHEVVEEKTHRRILGDGLLAEIIGDCIFDVPVIGVSASG
jgi:hypothetical protein